MKRKLLYFGAGDDPHPVYKKLADEYVYIDTIPNFHHFKKGQHGYNLFGTLDNVEKSLHYRFGDFERNGNVVSFKHFPVTYYLNTLLPQNIKDIQHELSDVTDLYVYCYGPDKSFYSYLPSLQRIWCTINFPMNSGTDAEVIFFEEYEYHDDYIRKDDSIYYFKQADLY